MNMTNKSSLFQAMNNLTSWEALKDFEASVMNMNINADLRNRLLRQATENYINACPNF